MEDNDLYKVIMMGPQGSGKGTQSVLLAHVLGVPALSMGQLLRDEVATGSALGRQIDAIIKDGNMVSEATAAQVLKPHLKKAIEAGGYVLDGYPRNMDQYRTFDFDTPTQVLVLQVPEEVSIARLKRRLVCGACGTVFRRRDSGRNRLNAGDECRHCDTGILKRRKDDRPEAISRRLELYREKTEPVIKRYSWKGLVRRIDGTGYVEVVHKRILEMLDIQR